MESLEKVMETKVDMKRKSNVLGRIRHVSEL